MSGLRPIHDSGDEAGGPPAPPELSGEFLDGRVAVGDHFVQAHPDHGALVTGAASGARPVPRAREVPRGTLPPDLPVLLGRESELRTAQATLASRTPVEVVGEPGIGKTALLRHLSRRAGSDGVVVFLRVGGLPGEDILQCLFESFYECEEAVVPVPSELSRALRDRRAVVVLDDADLARTELERLMRQAPDCAFAIAVGERRFWGEGRSITLHGLDEQSCLALAERELGRELSDQERDSLSRLARAVEGNPLRIVQAAHLLIDERRPRSDSPASSGPPQAQFDQVVAQSLDDHEVSLLGPLAALPGIAIEGSRIAELTGVSDAPTRLASLEQRGLVSSHGTAYALVGTVTGALGPRVDVPGSRGRLLEHFARAEAGLSAGEAEAVLALLAAGAEAGGHGAVVQVARNADAPLALGARWGAWREVLEHALAAARHLHDRRSEAWALHQLGSRAGCLGDLAGAKEFLGDAVQLREGLGEGDAAQLSRHNLEALRVVAPPSRQSPRVPAPPPPSPRPSPAVPAPPPPPPLPARRWSPAVPSPPSPPSPPAPRPTPAAPPTPPSAPAPPPPEPPVPALPAAPPPPSRPPPLQPRRPPVQAEPTGRRAWRPDTGQLPERLRQVPIRPVVALAGVVILLVLIVSVVSGGDDDATSPGREAVAPVEPAPAPEERAGRRAGRSLPAVVQPKALQFTAPLARRSKAQLVDAKNPGGARIVIGKVRLEGKDRRDFVATDGCSGTTLPGGEICRVALTFVPKRRRGAEGPGTRTATLTFTNDGKGRRQSISLTGSATAP